MFEPIITPGNENIVHHMTVYTCPTELDDKYNNHDYHCYHINDDTLLSCRAVFLAWAVGGEPFYLPTDVGMPLGMSEGPGHVVLETHYNNPTLQSGVIDSSGMRIHYTPTLRLHDVGVLQTGVMVDKLHIVPPEYESFKSRGYCTMACMERALTRSTAPEMNVFAVLQHTHLIGKGIRTRIVRNGTEIEPLIVEDNCDFDFQETRLLTHERKLQVGDAIITECDYQSKEKGTFTYGGLSTSDVMCMSFILYYPRSPMAMCWSKPLYDAYIKDASEKHALISYLHTLDWKNQTVRDDFQKRTDDSINHMECVDYASPAPYSAKIHPDPVTRPYVQACAAPNRKP
ncbi:DBH-like monooxygenase protein 1 homolog isoform X2 [Haliotis asinina]|uniref:DBH-like monooxygenase protein 1 homolog isoform X2 n=1 Tax=Haliotis asinina TaxID=109174 RepID=UPI0035319772